MVYPQVRQSGCLKRPALRRKPQLEAREFIHVYFTMGGPIIQKIMNLMLSFQVGILKTKTKAMAVALQFGFQLKAEQSIIAMKDAAGWRILNRFLRKRL